MGLQRTFLHEREKDGYQHQNVNRGSDHSTYDGRRNWFHLTSGRIWAVARPVLDCP